MTVTLTFGGAVSVEAVVEDVSGAEVRLGGSRVGE